MEKKAEKNNKEKKSSVSDLILLNIIVFIILYVIIFPSLILPSIKSNIAKPILYLYPKNDMVVEVKLEKSELIKTSYPKYNDGWRVFASTDGNLKIDNKNYYGLYWDEENTHEVDFSEGFYVEKDNAIEFLEEKLNVIGLNEREANEFIMYWLPILEDNGKSVVYFELTEERESNNRLLIDPKPDSMLRLVIHVKKVNSNPNNMKEEKLITFERKGFVAVEWGGVKYN